MKRPITTTIPMTMTVSAFIGEEDDAMDKYIWYLYDINTGCFGSGKLVYQKRKNGLFYDGKTHKPLILQPQYLGQEN